MGQSLRYHNILMTFKYTQSCSVLVKCVFGTCYVLAHIASHGLRVR